MAAIDLAHNLQRASRLKTYSHLANAQRVPTEYEVATSKLLWYVGRGFEVDVPLAEWYARYQTGSALAIGDWDHFVDPRETTYASYVRLQREREAFADGVLRTIEQRHSDESLSPEWVRTLERVLPVVRYPCHAMQMLSAYLGQVAPGGRIVIACALQAADEVRRIQRVVERSVLLRRTHPGFGLNARALWEAEPAWQPLREAVERALVVWDWGEAFVALDLCIAPVFDEVVMVRFADLAGRRGDPLLQPFFESLYEDCSWHRAWAGALVTTAIRERPGNREVLERWLAVWAPRAHAAARALDALVQPHVLADEALRGHSAFISSLGLTLP